MARDIHTLRNLGIIAHIDAGKTTLTERMLYFGGFSHRVGDVDKGTTVTDFLEEEQERGITIQAACVSFPWKDIAINLIDTPGHVDFTAEVERSLRVLDGGVVVFSAREGVEAQSETVWHQADKYRVPRVAFINKMDREGADFYATLDEIHRRLDCTPIPVNIPWGSGPSYVQDPFQGILDLIEMKAVRFDSQSAGREMIVEEIPEDRRKDAERWRAKLLDQLSMYSDELTELLLSEEQPPARLLRQVLREITILSPGWTRDGGGSVIVPVLCGSALDGVGVQPVLDAVAHYLPSPMDLPPVEGLDPKKKNAKATRKPATDEPFCGLLFKIQAERTGDLHFVRIYSGELKAGSRVLNAGQDKKENVPQLWRVQADHRKQIDSASAGDIVGVIGLHHSITGDTLCSPQHPILLESITFPETVIAMAIEPESSAERKKLVDVLEMLKRQDPTFRARVNEETGQTLISGMGELHLEIIKNRLVRDFKLNVRVHKPRVSYRETVRSSVEVTGQCHRTLGGQTLFAEVTIRMEPFTAGAKPVTVIPAAGDQIPPPFVAAAAQVLTDQGEGGGMLGFPLMNVKITIIGGKSHESESNETAFRMAAADAFNKALHQSGIVLLEPIMRIEVTVPEEHVGDVVSDLQQRRAIITRTQTRGKNTIIDAEAPLANLFGYAGAMRGLSQGRATCTMEPASYGPAPDEVLKTFL